MSRVSVLLHKDLLEQWRTLRMPVIAIVFFVFGLASPLLAKYTPELIKHAGGNIQITVPTPTVGDAVDQFIKNIGQIGPFAAILLAMGSVARERERGTAVLVLTKPVSRPGFLSSKFIALLATLAVGVVVAGLAAYAYTAALFSTLSVPGFAACCALVLVGTAVFAAITFLASTLVGSSLPAGGVGLGAYFLVAIASAYAPLKHVLPAGLEEPARALALGEAPPHLWISLGFNLLWIVACLVASWKTFQNQEFGG
jgi:ABC-2 type transport system permease protein